MIKFISLQPIKESTQDYEAVEKELIALFKREIYLPILKELKNGLSDTSTLVRINSKNDIHKPLLEALNSGRVAFTRGKFSGNFSAKISRSLRDIGATFDAKKGVYRISAKELPMHIRTAIGTSEARFKERLRKIDERLATILPGKISDQVNATNHFDRAIWKVEKKFKQSVKNITVTPELTKEEASRVSAEWNNNLKLFVKDFTEKETAQLRKMIQANVFAGKRYEGVTSAIQKSFNVSVNKAKFLARQETSLLMTKFKQTRYQAAGINEYKWSNVAGSKNHPVRPMHKQLGDESKKGRIFSWSNPPVTDELGNRNHPGQDYNCRCFAIPVVKFNKG